MASRVCLNHPTRPAVANCRQCAKPVCADCAETTIDGTFCSAACRGQFLSFQDRKVQVEHGSGLGRMLVQLVVAAAVALGLLYAAARWGSFAWAAKVLGYLGIRV